MYTSVKYNGKTFSSVRICPQNDGTTLYFGWGKNEDLTALEPATALEILRNGIAAEISLSGSANDPEGTSFESQPFSLKAI